MVEGACRECVGGHDVVCGLFPHLSNTHCGHAPLRMVSILPAATQAEDGTEKRPLRIGCVLSGGQAPGESTRGALDRSSWWAFGSEALRSCCVKAALHRLRVPDMVAPWRASPLSRRHMAPTHTHTHPPPTVGRRP